MVMGRLRGCRYGRSVAKLQSDALSAFGGKADIIFLRRECPLLTQSGHTAGSSNYRCGNPTFRRATRKSLFRFYGSQ